MSLMHRSIEKQIQETHGYERPLEFFKQHPGTAFEICMRTEEKLTTAYAILHLSMAELNKTIEMKNEFIKQLKDSHASLIQLKDERYDTLDRVIELKDECTKNYKDKCDAEQRELKSMLGRANMEVLKLAHNLSVRGMLEKIECQFSDKRRKEGPGATRRSMWAEILNENEHIKQAVIKTCTGKNVPSKVDMAIEAILEIYKRTSDEIHNSGYDEIPVKADQYHGQQLNVLRNLCAVTHYIMKEI